MPSFASITWPRTFSARFASAVSRAVSSVPPLRYLFATGTSRAKWGNKSKSSLGHMPLVYVLGQNRHHRSRAPAPPQQLRHHARQQDRRNNALRPQAIDTPLVDDIGLDVAEKRSAEESNARQFQHNPKPAPDREYPNQAVSHDSDHSNRNM